MDADHFRRVMEAFAEVCDLPPDERDEALVAFSKKDPEIDRQVRRLLEAERDGSGRLEPLALRGGLPPLEPLIAEAGRSLSGSRIAQFEVGEPIGHGGMGEVYAAVDTVLRRRVAIKAIRHNQRMSETARRRFLREAQMLSSLDHPNICRIHDYLRGEEEDFLVLELIQGRSLRRAVQEGLSRAAALSIAEQVADALAASHAEGVVHRDLKLSNVMLTDNGTAKILDFGLARPVEAEQAEDSPEELGDLASSEPETSGFDGDGVDRSAPFHTATGLLAGTPSAMSPEQIEGRPASAASDMYSFGLLVQELFTGEPPYDPGLTPGELVDAVRQGATRSVSGVDRHLAALVESLTVRQPHTRPTAAAVVARLRWIRDKPKRRLRRVAAAVLLALFALGGLKYTLDLRRERTVADQRRSQAEDLIGFMLGDLRAKLEPLGRLDVLDDVGDKAQSYFASVPSRELSAGELLHHSTMLNQVGGVRIAQGRLGDAALAFEESLRLAQDLVEREPDESRFLGRLGEAFFWLGYQSWEQGDLEGSYRYYSEYLASSQRLVALEPESMTWQTELAYGHANVGAVERRRGNLGSAEQNFRRSIEIIRGLVERDPASKHLKRELGTFLSWLASTLESRGDLTGAQEQFEEEWLLRRAALEGDESDADAKLLLAFCLGHLGVLHRDQGDVEGGLRLLSQQLELIDELASMDPANLEWQRHVAVARFQLGETLLADGKADAASASLEAGLQVTLDLVRADPLNSDWRLQRSGLGTATAVAWLAQGRPQEALQEAKRSLEEIEALLAASPDDYKTTLKFARNQVVFGQILEALGEDSLAEKAWELALERLEPLAAGSYDRELLATLATALVSLERWEDARPIAERLWAQGYQDPGFRELWRKDDS